MRKLSTRTILLAFLLIGGLAAAPDLVGAQEQQELAGDPFDEAGVSAELAGDAGEAEGLEAGALNYTLLQLIQFGGIVGYFILFLSLVAVALIIDDLLLLRRKVLLPEAEIDELRGLVEAGRGGEIAAGAPRSSFIGAMAVAGMRELERGYDAVVKGMEDAADEVAGRLLRRIEYLNVIANVAPMLGLLGTVIGMVRCFNQISVAAGGADPRLLAAGIFQALMTTVMGLMVAIPAFFAFSLFRNRVDALAAESAARAEEMLAPLRPGSVAQG